MKSCHSNLFEINSGSNFEPLAGFLADAVSLARISRSSWRESVIFPEKTSEEMLTDCRSEATRQNHLTLWSAERVQTLSAGSFFFFLNVLWWKNENPSIGTMALQHDYSSLIVACWVHRCRDTQNIPPKRENNHKHADATLFISTTAASQSVTSVYLINTNAEGRK